MRMVFMKRLSKLKIISFLLSTLSYGTHKMEAKLVALGVQTFQIALYLALPALLTGMLLGLAVSIFQATTQINEMTLSFIPKIIGVVVVIVLTMPWMLNEMTDFSLNIFNLIPSFVE